MSSRTGRSGVFWWCSALDFCTRDLSALELVSESELARWRVRLEALSDAVLEEMHQGSRRRARLRRVRESCEETILGAPQRRGIRALQHVCQPAGPPRRLQTIFGATWHLAHSKDGQQADWITWYTSTCSFSRFMHRGIVVVLDMYKSNINHVHHTSTAPKNCFSGPSMVDINFSI